MALTIIEAEGAREWIARPNRSLNPEARRVLVGGLVIASLIVSGGFMLAGAWMVLPFAGLEILALLFALRILARADNNFESIRLEEGRLTVSAHSVRGDLHENFHPGWARVSLEDVGGDTSGDPLLCIRSHGHSAHVGRLMTSEQRQLLATELRSHLPRHS